MKYSEQKNPNNIQTHANPHIFFLFWLSKNISSNNVHVLGDPGILPRGATGILGSSQACNIIFIFIAP